MHLREQRPKLLTFFEGLRPDQTFITFTGRSQADRYLRDLTPLPASVSMH